MVIRKLCVFVVCVAFFANAVNAQSPSIYRGKWQSHSTGHSGPMRVKLSSNADGTIDAKFSGRFALVIPFVYRAELIPAGGGSYASYKKLGPILGEYRMNSNLSPTSFNATFTAAGDHGSFTMHGVR